MVSETTFSALFFIICIDLDIVDFKKELPDCIFSARIRKKLDNN